MPKAERTASAAKKGGRQLKSVVAGAASTEALVDIVQKLGLADLLIDRVKARI